MIYDYMTYTGASLWWDARSEFGPDRFYRITVNNGNCIYTRESLYFFENLIPDTEYLFRLEVVDSNGKTFGEKEERLLRTKKDLKTVDIDAVGNGVDDVTETVEKALKNLKADERLHFPEGVYICDGITVNGNADIRLDSGVSLVKKGSII